MIEIRETNPIREQLLGTPAAILEQFDALESQTRKLLTTPEIYSLRRMILCGSGDSHMAGASAELAMEQFSGIQVEPLRAMEAARYTLAEDAPNNPLVIGISSSGSVARTFEALRNARAQGALTVALTSKPDSRVGQAAAKVLAMAPASLPSAPGYFGYALSMVALYLLAIRMGEVKGRLTQDQAYARREALRKTVTTMSQTAETVDPFVRALAAEWSVLDNYEFLGSGPSFATGMFGAAKILEATGAHAWAQDVEEWAHLQYFVAKPDATGTFLISPNGALAQGRVVEIASVVASLERPAVVLCGAADAGEYGGLRTLALPTDTDEMFSPLHYSIPLTLFAGYLSDATDSQYGRAHAGRWAASADGSTIWNSFVPNLE